MLQSLIIDLRLKNNLDFMNKGIIALLVVLVVALLAYFFLRQDAVEEEVVVNDELVMDEEVVDILPTPDVSVHVAGIDMDFSEKEIIVKEGDLVEIHFVNEGEMPHDLVIDELGVDTTILMPGEEATITFVASQAGTFEYYCSVGEHRAEGMVGTLIVEPA